MSYWLTMAMDTLIRGRATRSTEGPSYIEICAAARLIGGSVACDDGQSATARQHAADPFIGACTGTGQVDGAYDE
jgi:hypothetical protein